MENSNGKNHEHLSERQIEAHAARELSPGELLIADEHLAACDACFEKFKTLTKTRGESQLNFPFKDLFSATGNGGAHLSYEEQLEPYVDGTLSESNTATVENHLRKCRMCSSEVQDLQRFRIRLEQSEKAPAAETKAAYKDSFRSRLIFARSLPQIGIAFGSLAILLLIGAFIFFKFRENKAERISQTPNINSRANTNSAEIAATDPSAPPKNVSSVAVNPAENINKNTEQLPERAKQPEQANARQAPAKSADRMPREIENALSTGVLAKPQVLQEVAGNSVQLLGDEVKAESFNLESPKSVILNARPVFRWQPLAGATSYTVAVFDSNLKRVAKSEALAVNQWTPPANLKPGEVYQWQVTALKDGKQIIAPASPAPEAKFKILGSKESGRLQAALAQAGKANLARGILYARAGLLDDAEREFQAEISKNPKSQTARRFLEQIRSWRKNK